MEHTPAPWEVGPVDDCAVTHLNADGTRSVVAEIDGDYNQPETWPIMEANARLISAAPDLLEAVRDMEDFIASKFADNDEPCENLDRLCPRCESNGCIRMKLELARAAIAKATGA